MTEYIQLKRGLLRLREATVAEFAAHSGVKQATVKSFLHDHPKLVNPVRSARLAGRGRPATVWRLLPEGEATLLEEMKRLSKVVTIDIEKERDEGLIAVQRSLTSALKGIDDLKSRTPALTSGAFDSIHRRLKQRIAATQVALNDLREGGRSVIIEQSALDQAREEIARLPSNRDQGKEVEAFKATIASARASLQEYLIDWLNGVRREVEGFVAIEGWFMPDSATAAPMLLIDGIQEKSDALSSKIVEAARLMGAPVLHLPVGALTDKRRDQLFKVLAERLTLAAGVASQVVFTLDSEQPKARDLARGFVALNLARVALNDAATRESEQPLASAVLSTNAPLMANAGLAAASGIALAAPSLFAPASLVVAGVLSSRLSLRKLPKESTAAMHSSPVEGQHEIHVRTVCMDRSAQLRLNSVFSHTGIDYVAAGRFTSIKAVLQGPLALAPTAEGLTQ